MFKLLPQPHSAAEVPQGAAYLSQKLRIQFLPESQHIGPHINGSLTPWASVNPSLLPLVNSSFAAHQQVMQRFYAPRMLVVRPAFFGPPPAVLFAPPLQRQPRPGVVPRAPFEGDLPRPAPGYPYRQGSEQWPQGSFEGTQTELFSAWDGLPVGAPPVVETYDGASSPRRLSRASSHSLLQRHTSWVGRLVSDSDKKGAHAVDGAQIDAEMAELASAEDGPNDVFLDDD